MLGSCKLQLASLYLSEEVLSPMMVLEWIIAGCVKMPPLTPEKFQFTLQTLIELKKEASCLLSTKFDYAKFCATREQPIAYAPPQRRNSGERTWRTIGTQTSSFDLADWVQFQEFLKSSKSAKSTNQAMILKKGLKYGTRHS